MKHHAKSNFTYFMTFLNSHNIFLFSSLFHLLADSFYGIDGNFKVTAADSNISKLGGVCEMLPHYYEWIVFIFTSEVHTINLHYHQTPRFLLKQEKVLKIHKCHKMSKNQLSMVFHTPNKFYSS